MTKDLFQFVDYKAYLNSRLDDPQRGGRGSRARLSRSIGCQSAYTAQVLRGSAHFSLEQAEAISEFLGHDEMEGTYFFFLVQYQRAGSQKLKERLHKQILKARGERLQLKNRLGVKEVLSEADQVTYYSAWYYAAIHILATIPGFRSADAISRRLRISPVLTNQALSFLIEAGLMTEKLKPGTNRIHLANDSLMASKHHANWRMQALQSLEKLRPTDLHYSSVVSISRDDAEAMRENFVKQIDQAKAKIRASPEEDLYSFCLDFFRV